MTVVNHIRFDGLAERHNRTESRVLSVRLLTGLGETTYCRYGNR
ncbi:hypothetical protein [Gorillibacterium massiliense]|nr:hypothetical protein [Gorillibacterium massiliense]